MSSSCILPISCLLNLGCVQSGKPSCTISYDPTVKSLSYLLHSRKVLGSSKRPGKRLSILNWSSRHWSKGQYWHCLVGAYCLESSVCVTFRTGLNSPPPKSGLRGSIKFLWRRLSNWPNGDMPWGCTCIRLLRGWLGTADTWGSSTLTIDGSGGCCGCCCNSSFGNIKPWPRRMLKFSLTCLPCLLRRLPCVIPSTIKLSFIGDWGCSGTRLRILPGVPLLLADWSHGIWIGPPDNGWNCMSILFGKGR